MMKKSILLAASLLVSQLSAGMPAHFGHDETEQSHLCVKEATLRHGSVRFQTHPKEEAVVSPFTTRRISANISSHPRKNLRHNHRHMRTPRCRKTEHHRNRRIA
jgi:hypothetical protein